MYVVIGGGLLASGLLIVVLLTSLFARTQRGWLNAELTAMLLTIPPTAMIGVGAAFVLIGLAGDHRPIDLAALVGWLAIGAGLIWLLRRRREALSAAAAESGAVVIPLEPTPPAPKMPA